MKSRVGKKTFTIPKTNYTWIKLLDASQIDGISTLEEIIIQNIYIRRNDRYHHAKSSHVANAFTNLEFFFKADFKEYYCYFDSHPSNWRMECIVEYVVVGAITLNPIVIACVAGPGVLIEGYLTKSNLINNVEQCKFAYTNYKKILIQLKSFLRELSYDTIFLSDVKILDDIVIDTCPTIDKYLKKYNSKFTE